jgi:hypothetical protein
MPSANKTNMFLPPGKTPPVAAIRTAIPAPRASFDILPQQLSPRMRAWPKLWTKYDDRELPSRLAWCLDRRYQFEAESDMLLMPADEIIHVFINYLNAGKYTKSPVGYELNSAVKKTTSS